MGSSTARCSHSLRGVRFESWAYQIHSSRGRAHVLVAFTSFAKQVSTSLINKKIKKILKYFALPFYLHEMIIASFFFFCPWNIAHHLCISISVSHILYGASVIIFARKITCLFIINHIIWVFIDVWRTFFDMLFCFGSIYIYIYIYICTCIFSCLFSA